MILISGYCLWHWSCMLWAINFLPLRHSFSVLTLYLLLLGPQKYFFIIPNIFNHFHRSNCVHQYLHKLRVLFTGVNLNDLITLLWNVLLFALWYIEWKRINKVFIAFFEKLIAWWSQFLWLSCSSLCNFHNNILWANSDQDCFYCCIKVNVVFLIF